MKTKGEIEAEIGRAIVQFEMDYMGRGPKRAASYIIEDMVPVRLKGVLTIRLSLHASASSGAIGTDPRRTLISLNSFVRSAM